MATYTLSEAVSLLPKMLDRYAREAESYMKERIAEDADKGYQTGKLRDSINTRVISDNARGIGSDLEYAKYVNDGRGEVRPRPSNPTGLLTYYDPVLGRWVRTKRTGPMEGIHFIEKTKEHLESLHLGL